MGAERMNLADVVRQLREEGMWFNGIDRSAERRNARAEDEEDEQQRERETEKERRHRAEGSDDSVGTLRTNAESRTLHRCSERRRARRHLGSEHEEKQRKEKPACVRVVGREIKPTIPVSPVLNPPRLLRPISYIPETIAHLPPYSLDPIKAVYIPSLIFS
jgi:hypothetical protein